MELANTLVFLVMMMSGTDQPVMVFLRPFETATECNNTLRLAPPENKDKFICVRLELRPKDEPPTRKL